TPKKARKFKKPASPLKKQDLVLEDKPIKKPKLAVKSAPAKEDVSSKKSLRRKLAGVVIRDTHALLEAAQLLKVLKKSKQDTHMLYASGSDDGVGVLDVPKDQSESENVSWGDSGDHDDNNNDDSNDDASNDKDVRESDDDHDKADDERTESDDEEEEKLDDEFIHTPDDYVHTDDEINDKSSDVEMTVYGQVNVDQEGAGNQVKDDAQATQKTEGLILSSSISSDYTAKYLNFDKILPVDTEVVPMLDINVQHEVPQKDVKELKTVDHTTALLSTIQYEVPNSIKEYLRTSMDDALHKVLQKHIADITKEHSIPADIVERLRQQYVPEKITKDIRKTKMEHARKHQEPKETITSYDTTALIEFDQKTALFETMTKSKSFNKSLKQRALYHALME
nr:hypothetical protein [Tanacetum cinerariifolium]